MKFINFIAGVLWLFAAFAVMTGHLELSRTTSSIACILASLGFFNFALED